jgi:hypothetical protein
MLFIKKKFSQFKTWPFGFFSKNAPGKHVSPLQAFLQKPLTIPIKDPVECTSPAISSLRHHEVNVSLRRKEVLPEKQNNIVGVLLKGP